MSAVLAIAGLTFKEAVRRRFVYAGLVVCGLFLLIAFIPIHARHETVATPELTGEIIEVQFGHVAEFFAFLFAVALSAGTISNEVERGVLSVILPKPIGRWSVYVGKWLGVNAFVVGFMVVWVCILEFAIYNHMHEFMPNLFKAIFFMALYPIVFSSLTLFFSSITSNLLAMMLPLILSSLAWTERFFNLFGYQFDENSLKVAANVVKYAAPLDPLHKWVEKLLDPTQFEQLQNLQDYFHPVGPTPTQASTSDLVWIAVYGFTAFFLGLIVFQRRDI